MGLGKSLSSLESQFLTENKDTHYEVFPGEILIIPRRIITLTWPSSHDTSHAPQIPHVTLIAWHLTWPSSVEGHTDSKQRQGRLAWGPCCLYCWVSVPHPEATPRDPSWAGHRRSEVVSEEGSASRDSAPLGLWPQCVHGGACLLEPLLRCHIGPSHSR